MCGLTAFWSKGPANTQEIKIFKALFYLSALRGEHGSGLFTVNKENEVDYIKKPIPPADMLQLKTAQNLIDGTHVDPVIIVGHARHATIGSKTAENCHPFEENGTYLVHNGTLQSYHTLPRTEGRPATAGDSETLCYSLGQCMYGKDVLEQAQGAYAIIYYDTIDKKLRIAKNSERTLFIAKAKKDVTYFASSEKDMLLAALGHTHEQDNYTIEAVKDGQILEYNLDNPEKPRVVPFKIKERPVYKTVSKVYYPDINGNYTKTPFDASYYDEINRTGKIIKPETSLLADDNPQLITSLSYKQHEVLVVPTKQLSKNMFEGKIYMSSQVCRIIVKDKEVIDYIKLYTNKHKTQSIVVVAEKTLMRSKKGSFIILTIKSPHVLYGKVLTEEEPKQVCNICKNQIHKQEATDKHLNYISDAGDLRIATHEEETAHETCLENLYNYEFGLTTLDIHEFNVYQLYANQQLGARA